MLQEGMEALCPFHIPGSVHLFHMANVNCQLWVIMMYQCRLISSNKGTTVVQDVHIGGNCPLRG